MNNAIPLLTALAVAPLIGAVACFAVKNRIRKYVAFGAALVTLALGLVVFFLAGAQQLAGDLVWIDQIGAHYAFRLDGMGRAMVLLTVILVPTVLLAEWRLGEQDPASHAPARWQAGTFGALALMLESFALFVFMSADVLMFYIFFEATLIPMYFLVQGWGGAERGRAALKFLLFSLAGGLVMLFSVVGVFVATAEAGKPSFLIGDVAALDLDHATQVMLFAGFFFAFAVKAPMVPVHSWLPDTAEQATPGATTLLVGVLDKIGTFGMIRLCLGLVPKASTWATPLVVTLAVVSIVYGALLAISSKNLLRLVAYTSVSHFGFMVLGIFAFTTASISGSVFYMLAHGFSSAAMFLAIGFLQRRRGSAEIADFGGVQTLAPVLAGTFLVAGLATLGLPGTANFVGEYAIMSASWPRQTVPVAIAVFATVLAAVYVLWAYQRVCTGEPPAEVSRQVSEDLSVREKLVIGPLLGLLLLFGFLPQPMLDVVEPTAVDSMTQVQLTDPVPGSNGGK